MPLPCDEWQIRGVSERRSRQAQRQEIGFSSGTVSLPSKDPSAYNVSNERPDGQLQGVETAVAQRPTNLELWVLCLGEIVSIKNGGSTRFQRGKNAQIKVKRRKRKRKGQKGRKLKRRGRNEDLARIMN